MYVKIYESTSNSDHLLLKILTQLFLRIIIPFSLDKLWKETARWTSYKK